ncbi:MAG: DUF11 domain-containing protein [Phycisphaerales bacterium]|nr:DUF11 domain-containing protein [Phycisphaerales bacterium]
MKHIKKNPLLVGLFMITAVCVGSYIVLDAAVAQQATGRGGAGSPMVELTKRCPSLRYLGRNATFEITVTNRGTGTANDVVVTDVIPAGLDFVGADNGGTRQGNNIVWRVGKLDAGQNRVLKATFLCNRIGRFKNSARVTYCAEAVASCEMEVKGIPAILLECVDDPDPIEINGTLTYTITVTNQGTAVGTNIVINCTLPAQQEYVSATGPTNARAAGKNITFAPLPTLAAKAKATYRVKVRGVGEGDVRFRVELKSDQINTPVMETESTHIYQ